MEFSGLLHVPFYLSKVISDICYLRDTQHRIPERTRNHIEPMKRKTDNPAVAHRMTSKYHEVRVVDVFWREIMLAT
jgi:hypothetical protein